VTARAALVVALVTTGITPQTVDPSFRDVVRLADTTVRPRIIEKRLPADRPLDVPEGHLRVEFVIEPDGAVRAMRPAAEPGPYAALMTETFAILKRWTFDPAFVGADRVRVLATLNVTFATASRPARGTPASPAMHQTWNIEGIPDDFGGDAVRLPARDVTWPAAVRMSKPVYPGAWKGPKVNDLVELEILILADGKVAAARVIRSNEPRFEATAVKTAKEWTFRPAMKAGVAVPVVTNLVLEYRSR
jgi:TonB family protein